MELYTLTITYLKNEKMVTETFRNVTGYSLQEGMFWFKQFGLLKKNSKKDAEATKILGQFVSDMIWIPVEDITLIKGSGGPTFKSQRDLINFEEDLNK